MVIDDANPIEKTTDTSGWFITQTSGLTNVYVTREEQHNSIAFGFSERKGAKATVEFQLNLKITHMKIQTGRSHYW